MFYLGIDQHARQITISLRDYGSDVLQARQVPTRLEQIQAFFAKLTEDCVREEQAFIAVVEVCGFNDWLIKMLEKVGLSHGDPDSAGGTEEPKDGSPGRRGAE